MTAAVSEIPGGVDRRALERTVRKAVGDDSVSPGEFSSEQLAGGTVAGVFRLTGAAQTKTGTSLAWSCVLKILHKWERAGDPECWSREARIYRSGLYAGLPRGFSVPRCYELEEKEEEYRLWLEDVPGRRGTDLTREDYRAAARGLGRFQGRFAAGRHLGEHGWLAALDWREVTTGEMGPWAIERIRKGDYEDCPGRRRLPGMLRGLEGLWEKRGELRMETNSLPRTFVHRDFHGDNIFARGKQGSPPDIVLIDWDCAGLGIAGEDIGDVVAEAMVYFRYSPREAGELLDMAAEEYREGLADAGWKVPRDSVMRGVFNNWSVHWCFRIACGVLGAPEQRDREGLADRLEWMLSKVSAG